MLLFVLHLLFISAVSYTLARNSHQELGKFEASASPSIPRELLEISKKQPAQPFSRSGEEYGLAGISGRQKYVLNVNRVEKIIPFVESIVEAILLEGTDSEIFADGDVEPIECGFFLGDLVFKIGTKSQIGDRFNNCLKTIVKVEELGLDCIIVPKSRILNLEVLGNEIYLLVQDRKEIFHYWKHSQDEILVYLADHPLDEAYRQLTQLMIELPFSEDLRFMDNVALEKREMCPGTPARLVLVDFESVICCPSTYHGDSIDIEKRQRYYVLTYLIDCAFPPQRKVVLDEIKKQFEQQRDKGNFIEFERVLEATLPYYRQGRFETEEFQLKSTLNI